MRPKRQMWKLAARGLLAAGLLARTALAQAPPSPAPVAAPVAASTAGSAIIVAINGSQKLSLSTKKLIRSVINEKEAIARIQPIANDPFSVLVVGLTAGSTKVTLTDVDGKAYNFR